MQASEWMFDLCYRYCYVNRHYKILDFMYKTIFEIPIEQANLGNRSLQFIRNAQSNLILIFWNNYCFLQTLELNIKGQNS